MARRTRAAKKAQEEDSGHEDQSQEASSATTQPSTSKAVADEPESAIADAEKALTSSSPKGKSKQEAEPPADDHQPTEADATASQPQDPTPPTTSKQTMEERKERMAALRKKMAQTSTANRKDLQLDKQPRQNNRRDATNSRKLAKAEAVLDERDAKERGEDWERIKNWKYTIEDEERWEEMKDAKEERQDQGIIDTNSLAARSYARNVRSFKPDLAAYKREHAGEEGPSSPSSSSTALVRQPQGQQQVARRSELNPVDLSYGSHKPNDNAIDRVVSHINLESDVRDKRSRKRHHDDTGDVTYINDKNAAYNRKINRHFDQYTQEIRDNFERGTAL